MRTTIVDEIVDEMSGQILRGEFDVGQKLPSYRSLAQQFDVTLPTAQRVVDRLQELRLVEVRHGSGARVLDARESTGAGMIPAWIMAYVDVPDTSAQILADFLGMRRVLAAELVVSLRGRDLSKVRERIAELAVADEPAPADLRVVRAILEVAGNLAYTSVFNTLATLQTQIPAVAKSMYQNGGPVHAEAYSVLLDLVEDGDVADGALRDLVRGALEIFDADTVREFRTHMGVK